MASIWRYRRVRRSRERTPLNQLRTGGTAPVGSTASHTTSMIIAITGAQRNASASSATAPAASSELGVSPSKGANSVGTSPYWTIVRLTTLTIINRHNVYRTSSSLVAV
jgi:hypothetical protein